MKFLIASTLVLLATAPALAQQATIFADNEAANATAPAESSDSSISLEGFSGGVSTADAHDSGGGMMIQMLMPNAASAATGTPGPVVAHAAVTGSAH